MGWYLGGSDTSWTWNKIMKLSDVACEFVNYKIGNGQTVWCWYDKWHPLGPLIKRFGNRIVYDAASRCNAKMEEFVGVNG